MRRLPVYIVIDTSTSMRGEPIEAVKAGLNSLIESLRHDPYALETVCLSIITYDSKAEQVLPLTEVYKVILPELVAKGRSVLGEALSLLSNRYDEEVRKNTAEQKGDWKPLMFLLADGGSTGPLAKSIAEFKKRTFSVVVACAAGSKVHADVLQKITKNIVYISSNKTEDIMAYFKWISNSIGATSSKIDYCGDNDLSLEGLPPMPQEIMVLHKDR